MKLSAILIAIILAIVILLFIGWSRAPDMLANSLSKKMKVSVEIDDISLTMNSITIDKFEIGNPKGSILPKAFSASTINLLAPLRNYFYNEVIIDEMDLDNIYLGIEFDSQKSKKGNWTTIMGNLKAATANQKSKKVVLIKKAVLTNIQIDLAYRKEGKVQHLKPVDRLVFTNISSENGIPTDQITKIIFDQMLQSIFQKENLENMLQDLLQPNQTPLQRALSPFKNLFGNNTEEATQDAVNAE